MIVGSTRTKTANLFWSSTIAIECLNVVFIFFGALSFALRHQKNQVTSDIGRFLEDIWPWGSVLLMIAAACYGCLIYLSHHSNKAWLNIPRAVLAVGSAFAWYNFGISLITNNDTQFWGIVCMIMMVGLLGAAFRFRRKRPVQTGNVSD